MNMTIKRLLALALAAALTLSLAACGKKDGETSDPSPSPSQEAPAPEIEFLPKNETDVTEKVLGYPGETTLFTVNGQTVSAEEYLYWLGNMTSYYEMMMMYSGQTLNFDEAISEDGVTWGDQLKEIAYQNSLLLAVTPEVAAQRGVSLSGEDVAGLIQQRQSNIDNAGGEEMYAYQLQSMGINDETAFQLDKVSALFAKIQESVAADVTDADVDAYIAENDLLRCKHILLKTVDDDRQPLDEATVAQKKAQAEELLARLQEDPTQFDDLMNENSEDTGLATNPDGYLFSAGEMVAVFEDTTRALEVNAISGVVESEYGYHIIMRLDPDCDQSRQEVANEKFNTLMEDYVNSASVEKMAEYEAITTKDYYTALTEFQDSLEAPTQVDDMADATLEPQPDGTAAPADE